MENSFLEELLSLWTGGGWLMIPLALLSGFIYYAISDLYLSLKSQQYHKLDPDLWGHWVDKPEEAEGQVKDLLTYVWKDHPTMDQFRSRFQEVISCQLPYLDQRIRALMIMVSAAPLTGLLGTVTGMLSTFSGLSASSGASSIDLVAGGISEALFTTETGLVLAIPAYVILSRIKRMRDDLELFLRRTENLTLKRYSQQMKKPTGPAAVSTQPA